MLSVTDKTGIVELAKGLLDHGIGILSTGGTGEALKSSGVPFTQVSEFTGFPELFNGRLKTIHPKIAGGTLYIRSNPEHMKQAEENGIVPIDFVAINLYQFEKTISKPGGVTLDEAVENIDIGGPSGLRQGAKNWRSVTVLSDPSQYEGFLEEMSKNGGQTTEDYRYERACDVFRCTYQYDMAIVNYLDSQSPDHKKVGWPQ